MVSLDRASGGTRGCVQGSQRDWYLIADQPAPALLLARPQGQAALRLVPVTVPRVSRSCEKNPDRFGISIPTGVSGTEVQALGGQGGGDCFFHSTALRRQFVPKMRG